MARLHVDGARTTRSPTSRPSRSRHARVLGQLRGAAPLRRAAFADIIDIVFTARPAGISFEAANPRHAHEWQLFERVKLPAGKVLIPGVLDSTTNFIEHPELVAERDRPLRAAGRPGERHRRDATAASAPGSARRAVDPDIAWAKLASMAEGARRATREFW